MSVCTRKDGQIFVNWVEGGKRKRKYFGKGTKGMAEAVRFNQSITSKTVHKNHGPIFIDLVNAYLEARGRSLSEVSRDNLVYKLRGVILPELGELSVMTMTHEDLDRYVVKRSRIVKQTTIHRELSDVRAILNFAVRRRLITNNPIAGYEMPKRDDATILPLSTDEIQAIIDHSPEHLRRAMLLSFYTGLRPGAVELLSITYNQVNWKAGSITIISAQKGGAKQAEIPIHESLPLQEWFVADGSDPERHIITWKGKPIFRLKTAFQNAKKRAGVGGRKIPMYALRKSFVSLLVHNGIDLKTIADISRHDIVTMIKHYAHSMSATRLNAIASLPSLHPLGAKNDKKDEG